MANPWDKYKKKEAAEPAKEGVAPWEKYSEASTESPKGWADQELPIVGGTPRGYAKGALETLPVVGAVGGGLLGGMVGGPLAPATAVGGAAAGGVAGQSLKEIL
jgi:hypothetical protein